MISQVQLSGEVVRCFDLSAAALFREYLRHNPGVTKWIISADFALHQRDRPADCFAFTILPYDAVLGEIETDAMALRKDLKKSKDLNEQGITWLRDSRRFHIAILANKDRVLFSNGSGSDSLSVARKHVDLTLDEAMRQGRPAEEIRRLKLLKEASSANGFNVALLADIWLLSLWFATLTTLIARERRCDVVGWFPDRDNMTTFCDGIWQDYTFWNIHAIVPAHPTVDLRTTKLIAGCPDRSGTVEVMWYDFMIRSAGWFAGSLAAWDLQLNQVPADHQKYLQMIEQVVADAENVVVLRATITGGGAQISQVKASRHE